MRTDVAYPVAYPVALSRGDRQGVHLTCSTPYGFSLAAPTAWLFPDSSSSAEKTAGWFRSVAEKRQTLVSQTVIARNRQTRSVDRPVASTKFEPSSPTQLFVTAPTDSGGHS
jgi:hypothetical protein